MRTGPHHGRKTGVVVLTTATLVLLGGLLLEGTLVHAQLDAGADLPEIVAWASSLNDTGSADPGRLEGRTRGEISDAPRIA